MYSTIGGGAGTSQQVNFTVTATTSQTISALYIAQNIVDVAGLLVAVQNTSGSAITLTATGSIVNTASFASISTGSTVVIQPNATVVIETNLANLDYFIVSSSVIPNVFGGTAGQLIYQSAANQTAFVTAGSTGQLLQANGTGAPTWINPIANSVSGGSAGNILYQSATNVTGFVPSGTNGQILVSNGAAAPSWATLSSGIGTTITNTGSAINIKTPRQFTLYANGAPSGSTMQALITAYGITDIDGTMYSVVNNTGSTYQLNLVGCANLSSYSGNNTFLNGNTINLFDGQTVNIQTYIASNPTYTIVSTTQTQEIAFVCDITSMGSPPTTDTLINYVSTSDPLGWFNNTTHRWTPQKAGYYFITASFAFTNTSTLSNNNIQLRKNGGGLTINAWQTSANTSSIAPTGYTNAVVYFNGSTDYVDATVYNSAGGLTVNTGVWSQMSGMMIR